jgi:hypothetical protein
LIGSTLGRLLHSLQLAINLGHAIQRRQTLRGRCLFCCCRLRSKGRLPCPRSGVPRTSAAVGRRAGRQVSG